jgi:hypothetical protein
MRIPFTPQGFFFRGLHRVIDLTFLFFKCNVCNIGRNVC